MIVHIDSAINWRGGQQQVYLLHRQLRRMGIDSIVLTPGKSALFERCRDEGLEVATGSKPWHLLSNPIRRIIGNCDILHVHDSPSATTAAFAQRIRPGLDVICHRRISYALKPRHASRWKYRNAKHWIAVSPEIERQLLAAGVEAGKTSVIPSAIDVAATMNTAAAADTDVLRAEFDIPHDAPVITSIGALVPQKAHDIVLKAAALIHKTTHKTTHKAIHKAIFLIIGEGRLRLSLEEKAHALGLGTHVRFTGFRTDIPALLKLATIHIAASIKGEGSPAVIKEAMCACTPVIASDIEAHRLIVGKNGILTPAYNATSLGAAIMTLLNEPDRLQKIVQDASQHVDRFRPETMTESTLSIYQKIIGTQEKP